MENEKDRLLRKLAQKLQGGDYGDAIFEIKSNFGAYLQYSETTDAVFSVIDNFPIQDNHRSDVYKFADLIRGIYNFSSSENPENAKRILNSLDRYVERRAAIDAVRAVACLWSIAHREVEKRDQSSLFRFETSIERRDQLSLFDSETSSNDALDHTLLDHALDGMMKYIDAAAIRDEDGETYSALLVARESKPDSKRFGDALEVIFKYIDKTAKKSLYSALDLAGSTLKIIPADSVYVVRALQAFDQYSAMLAAVKPTAIRYIADEGAKAPADSEFAKHVVNAVRFGLAKREEIDGSDVVHHHAHAHYCLHRYTAEGTCLGEVRAEILSALNRQVDKYMASGNLKTVEYVSRSWEQERSGSDMETYWQNAIDRNLNAIAITEPLLAAKLSARLWLRLSVESQDKSRLLESFGQYMEAASYEDAKATIALGQEVGMWSPKDCEIHKRASETSLSLERHGPMKPKVSAGFIASIAKKMAGQLAR